jgi:hypothetical protein
LKYKRECSKGRWQVAKLTNGARHSHFESYAKAILDSAPAILQLATITSTLTFATIIIVVITVTTTITTAAATTTTIVIIVRGK